MDHSLSQNPPLHWGYSTNNNNNNNSSSSSNNNNNPTSSWQPILINNNNNNNNSNNNNHHRGTKRPLSESDCDDAYSEESSKDQCTSPGDTDSCQMLSRKKRRGVIEKKRRDRINMSLSELKRLVPSAFEKQGSAKLEKAEILALTVDHLKSLHAKGLDSLAFEQQKYAVDYHGMGFRECLAEVTRYLDRVEGMDPQNPMRLRLTSHLQCCAAQKELQLKQATSVPPWTPYGSPHHHQTYPSASTLNPLSSPSNHHHHPHQLSSLPPSSSSSSLHHHHHHHHPHSQQMHQAVDLGGHYDVSTSCAQNILTPLTPTESNRLAPPPSATSTLLTPLTTTTSSALAYSPHHQYPPPSSSSVMNSFGLPPSSSSSSASSSHNQNNYSQSIPNSQGMKPYRPWGAEVAY